MHVVFQKLRKKLLIGFDFNIYGSFNNILPILYVLILLVCLGTSRRLKSISKISYYKIFTRGDDDIELF